MIGDVDLWVVTEALDVMYVDLLDVDMFVVADVEVVLCCRCVVCIGFEYRMQGGFGIAMKQWIWSQC